MDKTKLQIYYEVESTSYITNSSKKSGIGKQISRQRFYPYDCSQKNFGDESEKDKKLFNRTFINKNKSAYCFDKNNEIKF